MSIQHSALSLGRALSSTFQTGDINLINSGRLYSDVLLEDMKKLFIVGHAGIQNAVHYISNAAPSQGTGAPEESVVLQNQNTNVQRITNNDRGTEDIREQHPENHRNSLTSEAEELEEGGTPHTNEAHSSNSLSIPRPRRTWVWIVMLVVGVLSLVIVPSLVVGIITGQLPWGIALAGAIATIVSFFSSLYYYHNK